MVKIMLELGMQPDKRIDLSEVIASSSVDTLEMFLETRVHITYSYLTQAMTTGRCDILELLLQCVSPHWSWDHDYGDVISCLATDGKIEIIRVMLKYEAPISRWVHRYRHNIIRGPVTNGHLEMVRLILEHGALPNLVTKEGKIYNSLSHAAANDHLEMVMLLLEHKVRVHYEDSDKGTPLQATAARGGEHSEQIAELLLDRRAWIDEMSENHRNSPLAVAVQHGDENMVRFLLKRGARPKAGFRYDDNPIKMAKLLHASDPEKYTRIMNLLRHKGREGNRLDLATRSAKQVSESFFGSL